MPTTAALLTIVSEPTRFRIVEAMRQGECAVMDIVRRVDIEQSGVSRHLRILSEAGIVRARPDGQRRLYSLRAAPFLEMREWIDGYRDLWEARLDRFGAELDRRQQVRTKKPKGKRS